MTKRQNSKAEGRDQGAGRSHDARDRDLPVRSIPDPDIADGWFSGFVSEGLGISRGILLFILSVDFHVGLASRGILGSRCIICWLVIALSGLGVGGDVSVTDGFSGLAIVDLVRPLCACYDQLNPHHLRKCDAPSA
jgi:hypothetical protein